MVEGRCIYVPVTIFTVLRSLTLVQYQMTTPEFDLGVWICAKCFEENPKDSCVCTRCRTALPQRGKTAAQISSKEAKQGSSSCDGQKVSNTDTCVSKTKPMGAEPSYLQSLSTFDPEEHRIVLLGKTGAGKSTTANTILKENYFTAKASPKSVTKKCQYVRKDMFNRKILLVDTPGLFDTNLEKDIVENEIKKCIAIAAPGPHAFLLVTSLAKRFTEEELLVFSEIGEIFGDHMLKYLIVVFTDRDQVDDPVESHMQECPGQLKKILEAAGGGYVTFNNKGKTDEKENDVRNLLHRIEEMLRRNGGGHFTSEMFEEAEQIIQDRINMELQDMKCEMRREIEQEMNAKIKKEREEVTRAHQKDVARIGKLEKQLGKEREKSAKKYRKESEKQIGELLQKEMEINERQMKLQQNITSTEGTKKKQLQEELALVEEERKQITDQRRRAEEVLSGERLTTSFITRACEVREEVRQKTEKEDEETIRQFEVIKMFKRFLNLFKEK